MPYEIKIKQCWNVINKKTNKIIKKCYKKLEAKKYIKNKENSKPNKLKLYEIEKKKCYQVINKENGSIKARCSTKENAQKQYNLLMRIHKKQIGGSYKEDLKDKLISLKQILNTLKNYQSISLLINDIGKDMFSENKVNNKIMSLIKDINKLIKIYKKRYLKK